MAGCAVGSRRRARKHQFRVRSIRRAADSLQAHAWAPCQHFVPYIEVNS